MNMLKHFCNVRRDIQVVIKVVFQLCNTSCVIWMCVNSQKRMSNNYFVLTGKSFSVNIVIFTLFFPLYTL